MTNLEARPEPISASGRSGEAEPEVLTAREVPLGGPRAMLVRRTIPQRERTLIGAWCFCDHYGPDEVSVTGGMKVAPHPHTGLQTVSWLFSGAIVHRDSVGTHATVRPGELNLMTAGKGISHSEVSTADTTTLHGAQLWVALPAVSREVEPRFDHYAPPLVEGDGFGARVFLGALAGSTSPVETFTPLLGAEIVVEPGAEVVFEVDPTYEHGVLLDIGTVTLPAAPRPPDVGELAYLPPGAEELRLVAGPEGARVLVLGGPPFGESIVMWWNFLGGSHEEVVAYRADWQAQITRGAEGHDSGADSEDEAEVVFDSQDVAPGRFGVVVGDHLAPLPAPRLPNARLRSRS